MLKGSDYESHVARLANRFLRRQLGVAATVFSSQRNQAALATLLDDAETRGNINADETDELDETDLILTADGPTDYILAEISITIQQHDVDRAAHRAALLAKATGQAAPSRSCSYPNPPTTEPSRREFRESVPPECDLRLLAFWDHPFGNPAVPPAQGRGRGDFIGGPDMENAGSHNRSSDCRT